MTRHLVSIVRYEKPLESVRKAVELSRGLEHLPPKAKVFIKPNIVFWTRATAFPKWGVITTSRVMADMVALLRDAGAGEIVIGEGIVLMDPADRETPRHAFETLGYGELARRYGVRSVNLMERPFKAVDLGDGIRLNFSREILESDFVVNLPVLKTHNQTMVSLGIKNLKGTIDISSRKRCHSTDPQRDLHCHVSRLADPMPPMFTLIDGIYTNERGPGFDGRMRRADLLVASSDVLSADLVGARLLGQDPAGVPHLAMAAARRGRPVNLSDLEVVGEDLAAVARPHAWDFTYSEKDGDALPLPLAQAGLQGLSYRKYDLSMCTYCSGLNGLILSAIRMAWKGEPWEGVEVLTGKSMKPTPGKRKTILLGRCMAKANADHPDIAEAILVKGCPPKPERIVAAFGEAGIALDPELFRSIDQLPGFFMARYADRPEFDERFFTVQSGDEGEPRHAR
jgi:uncharacterized protein (DUF362 family)